VSTNWFVSIISMWGHEIRCLAIQKLIHLVSRVCWCIVLAKGVKVKLFPQVCESDCYGHFCGYNVKTSTEPNKVRHQRRAALQ